MFDPFNLSLEVTPKSTRDCLKNEEFSTALIMALKLNEANLVQEVIERIPYKDGEFSNIFPIIKFFFVNVGKRPGTQCLRTEFHETENSSSNIW